MDEPTSLLLVEDDDATRAFLADNLAADGFRVATASAAGEGLRAIEVRRPDLVVLDLTLEDGSGLALLDRVRSADGLASRLDPDLPVIVLTGRSGESDRVRSFARGADDHVCKPFLYTELLGRIRAVLRRACGRRQRGALRVGELALDPATRAVRLAGRPVELSAKEFALLQALAEDPTRVYGKNELLRDVWGYRSIGTSMRMSLKSSKLQCVAKLRLDGYVRVSRVGGREGDSFISPDVQREQIERWAELRGVEIAAWHEDLDQSGGKLSRPGLDALMERVRTGQTGGVAVARLDRLSRAGVVDALRLIEELDAHGAQLAAIDVGIDPTTAWGEFAITLSLALGRMELRRIKDNWATAQGRRIAGGRHFAPRVVLGYERGADGRLVPNGDADIVRELFRRRADGASWLELARYLDAARPRSGGGNWMRQTVRAMVESRTYLGEAHHGSHRNPHAHQPLVNRHEFEAAQSARRTGGTPRGGYLLSGIARCASCRYRLRGTRLGAGKPRIYKCKARHAAGNCPAPVTVTADALERWVQRRFFGELEAFEVRGVADSRALAEAHAKVDEAEAELVAFRDDLRVREALGTEHWLAGLETRRAALTEAEDALRHALRGARALALPEVGDSWDDLTLDERRHVLSAAIDAVFVRRTANRARRMPLDERAVVLFRGEGPTDLPMPGAAGGCVRGFSWDDDPRGMRVAPT